MLNRFCLSLALVLFATSAFAASPNYIEADSLPPTLLVPPPVEGDAAWKRDMAVVEEAQRHISTADMTALKEEQHISADTLVRGLSSDRAGAGVTRDKMPKTFALLDNLMADIGAVVNADKNFWHTRRPYLTDPNVRLYVDRIDASPGYPSGHTCTSYVLAEVLAMIYPEQAVDLRARAAQVAQHRIQAGVHSPSDVAGGRTLGAMIVGALLQSADFKADLATARRERAER